jgi:hypothetical protein
MLAKLVDSRSFAEKSAAVKVVGAIDRHQPPALPCGQQKEVQAEEAYLPSNQCRIFDAEKIKDIRITTNLLRLTRSLGVVDRRWE